MKRSSRDKQLGWALPLESATSQSGQTNHPRENERAGCKSPNPHLSEERGEVFFLDILFHRMSATATFASTILTEVRLRHIAIQPRGSTGFIIPGALDGYGGETDLNPLRSITAYRLGGPTSLA
jgi:hypothetical protein